MVDYGHWAELESSLPRKLYGLEKELFLAHMGRKGQKWGVQNGPPYPLNENKLTGYAERNEAQKKNWSEYSIAGPNKKLQEEFHISDGERMHDIKVFAGKGTSTPLDEETMTGLSEQIGGNPENWQHAKGHAKVNYYGEEREAEIHWFQEASVGKHKLKIKKWLDD